ncbi:pilus assembly protein PilP [Pseudomonas sp. SDO5271_S396]
MSLSGLDFSALSHNAAKWPLPGKVLLGCALAGLVLVVGECLSLGPSRERLQQAEVREGELQQQLAHKTTLSASLEDRVRRLQVMQEKVEMLWQSLPGRSEVPALLDDIARLAAVNGLLVEAVAPLEQQAQSLYSEQSLQVTVAGGYHDLATFVSALGGLGRLVIVRDMTLRSVGPGLRLDLLASSYWREQAGRHGVSEDIIAPVPGFAYDAAALRDPFRPLAVQVARAPGRTVPAPDLARPRGALEGVATDRFEMVGTLSRGAQTFALLRAASEVHRLAVGDYLGPDHGRITAIHDDHVELVELFPDEQGAWLERSRSLVLNVNS